MRRILLPLSGFAVLGLLACDRADVVERFARPEEMDLWVDGHPVTDTEIVLERRGDRVFLAGIEMSGPDPVSEPTEPAADTTVSPVFRDVPYVQEALARGVPASVAVREFVDLMHGVLEEARRVRVEQGWEAAFTFLRESEIVEDFEGDSSFVNVEFTGMLMPTGFALQSELDRPYLPPSPPTTDDLVADLRSRLATYLDTSRPSVLFLSRGAGAHVYVGEGARTEIRETVARTLELGRVPEGYGHRPSRGVLEDILRAAS